MNPLKAGALYFACVFGAGFVLGTIRVLLLQPHLGARTAELLEMPAMLVVMLFAARWVARRFDLVVRQRLATGVIGLGLLLSAEVSMVWLRGLTLAQWLATRDPVSGPVYGAMLVLFALLPWLVARR